MNRLSPQNQVIFDHLLRGGTLTSLEATKPPFNTVSLQKRLSEIRATGIIIDQQWEGNGKKRWLRYSYHAKPQQRELEYGWIDSPYEANP